MWQKAFSFSHRKIYLLSINVENELIVAIREAATHSYILRAKDDNYKCQRCRTTYYHKNSPFVSCLAVYIYVPGCNVWKGIPSISKKGTNQQTRNEYRITLPHYYKEILSRTFNCGEK